MKSSESAIRALFLLHLRPLIDYARQFAASKEEQKTFCLNRSFLNFIQAKSEQAEELLDIVGARNNTKWFPLREIVALLKNFSIAAYELLHIRQACQFYCIDNPQEFIDDTDKRIASVQNVLAAGLKELAKQLRSLRLLSGPSEQIFQFLETDEFPRLPRDRQPLGSQSVHHRIDYLAIRILNSTEEVNQFRHLSRASEADWETLDFDFLCEAKLRTLEVNMHVLQAMYDTYISDSATESQDADLPKLRGRISVTYHLLRIATIYMHFYERHIAPGFLESGEQYVYQNCVACLDRTRFAHGMLKYFAFYLSRFLAEARSICSTLLRKYCVTKTVEVKAPPYIGFHVRPSSLVAAIVMHYGCDVEMHLGDSVYDASIFANIAMANNYLDQKKRAFISEKIQQMDLSQYEKQIENGTVDRLTAIKEILFHMASQDLIRIYAAHPTLCQIPNPDDPSLKSQVFECIKYLMNTDRQIGIVYDATVTFTGPEQAVDDIAALAAANYAESERGDDLPLPKQLDYLNFRRKTLKRPANRPAL